MADLIIGFNDGKEIGYNGEDAIKLYEEIFTAGRKGFKLTKGVALSNGYVLRFNINNITRVAYREGVEGK